MKKSAKGIGKVIKLLEKAQDAKSKKARVNKIRDAREKLAEVLKDAKGPDPEDPPE